MREGCGDVLTSSQQPPSSARASVASRAGASGVLRVPGVAVSIEVDTVDGEGDAPVAQGVNLRGEWARNHVERYQLAEDTGAPYAELYARRFCRDLEVDAVARVYRYRPLGDVTAPVQVLPFGWLAARSAR